LDPLDLAVDHFLRRFRLRPPHLEALVLAELGRRAYADLEFEPEWVALALRGGDDLDIRVPDRAELGIEQRLFVPLRERLPDGLLEAGAEPESLDHQRGRRFPLAEARQTHFAGQPSGSALEAAADVLRRDLDLNFRPRPGQFGDGGLHHNTSRFARC